VFKKAICGLEIRPIYYGATATWWWEIAWFDSELPPCTKRTYRGPRRASFSPILSPARHGVSPPRPTPGPRGLPTLPPSGRQMRFLCSSTARLRTGRFTRGIVVFKYLVAARARPLARALSTVDSFSARVLPPSAPSPTPLPTSSSFFSPRFFRPSSDFFILRSVVRV